MLDHFFGISQHGSTVRREILAGVTTFVTMAYILFVQPAMLSIDFAGNETGLSTDAVLLATCLASALASLIMGLYAGYPIALAPGMGQNAFFVSVTMTLSATGQSDAWRTALGIVFVAGIIFLMLSLLGVREAIINALSASLRNSIAVGIGLFIALIGLKNGSIVVDHPATLLELNRLGPMTADWAVFWGGFLATAVLTVRRVPGSILWGIMAGTLIAACLGQMEPPHSIVGLPQDNALLQMDLAGTMTIQCILFIFIFLYMDVFDTMGTLVGVAEQANLVRAGRLPRLKQALLADAVGTVAGAGLGTSTVTSYIESAAGVQQGGRTGLTSVTVAVLFLLALPLTPIIGIIGTYGPITAPALVLVGAMMFRNVTRIEWSEPSEAIPSFLIVAGIPLSFSIADGISLGLVSYPILKLLGGKHRDVHWVLVMLAVVLVVYFVARVWMLR